jgi:hypothetical protein
VTEIRGSVSCGDRYKSWDNTTSEESMINNTVQGGALLRIGSEDLLHKFTCFEGDIPVRRELVLVIADAPEKE